METDLTRSLENLSSNNTPINSLNQVSSLLLANSLSGQVMDSNLHQGNSLPDNFPLANSICLFQASQVSGLLLFSLRLASSLLFNQFLVTPFLFNSLLVNSLLASFHLVHSSKDNDLLHQVSSLHKVPALSSILHNLAEVAK